MLLDLARTALASEALVLVLPKELLDDALAHGRGSWVIGEGDLVPEHVAKCRVTVRALERRAPVQHLVD